MREINGEVQWLSVDGYNYVPRNTRFAAMPAEPSSPIAELFDALSVAGVYDTLDDEPEARA